MRLYGIDLIKELNELEVEWNRLSQAADFAEGCYSSARYLKCNDDTIKEFEKDLEKARNELYNWEGEQRLADLRELKKTLGEHWNPALVLVSSDDMVAYAVDYATEKGIPDEDYWPYNHIDWEEAAEELRREKMKKVKFEDGSTICNEYWYLKG